MFAISLFMAPRYYVPPSVLSLEVVGISYVFMQLFPQNAMKALMDFYFFIGMKALFGMTWLMVKVFMSLSEGRYGGEWFQNNMEGHGVVKVEIPNIEPVPGSNYSRRSWQSKLNWVVKLQKYHLAIYQILSNKQMEEEKIQEYSIRGKGFSPVLMNGEDSFKTSERQRP
ncbi:unnamed protein product [Fraxinus pennsylvanica]|uniref:Uncharacterized protein n=1 Tax=Fraxinus pennsylvanica TaxID=56036 RepID=A0AAD1ZJX1_9LAMI|nr:unnamed protein product [Fraxinus pennsylvanica]